MNALKIDRLALGYGPRTVVHELSLALAAGEIGCLLGPSGCGKTTVLRAVAGFETPRAGEIRLGDSVVAGGGHWVAPEARRVGMVFQDYALFPHLTVAGNIGFGLRRLARPARAARVREMLELIGLPDAGAHYPHELSGGQQQRVALARALAQQPRLLLLDEPFSNLDVELRERLSLEVRAILKAAGTTALLVTHDQREAFAMADRVGVMAQGLLRQWASPYDLYHEPADRWVANFVGEGVFLPATVNGDNCVDFELGQLCRIAASTASPPAGAVEVLIRPDDILHDDASPMRAQVLAKTFRGAQFLYTLALPSGRQVLSLVPSHHDHAIGEHIGIRIEIDHLIAFAKTE